MSLKDVVENLHKLPVYDKQWVANSRHMKSTFIPLLPTKYPGGAAALPSSPPPDYPGSPVFKKLKHGKISGKIYPLEKNPLMGSKQANISKASPQRRSSGDGQSFDRVTESETSFVHPVPDMFPQLPPGNKPLPPFMHPAGSLKPLKSGKKRNKPNALSRLGRAPSPFLSDTHINTSAPVDIPFGNPWDDHNGGVTESRVVESENQEFDLDISQTPFPRGDGPTDSRPQSAVSEQPYSEYPYTDAQML